MPIIISGRAQGDPLPKIGESISGYEVIEPCARLDIGAIVADGRVVAMMVIREIFAEMNAVAIFANLEGGKGVLSFWTPQWKFDDAYSSVEAGRWHDGFDNTGPFLKETSDA